MFILYQELFQNRKSTDSLTLEGAEVCTAQNWGMVTTNHEPIPCSYRHLRETQGLLRIVLPYSRGSSTSEVLQRQVHKLPLFNRQIQITAGVSAMHLVPISYYYCSILLWFIFWPGGTTGKLLANSDEITLHTATIFTCGICAEVFEALRRCLESMNPLKKL